MDEARTEKVIDLDELERVVLKLKALLDDRHPGLFTWNDAMGRNLRDLTNLLEGAPHA